MPDRVKLVMIGNMQYKQYRIYNSIFRTLYCVFLTQRNTVARALMVYYIVGMYYINRNKNPEQEARCSSLLYATSLQKAKIA